MMTNKVLADKHREQLRASGRAKKRCPCYFYVWFTDGWYKNHVYKSLEMINTILFEKVGWAVIQNYVPDLTTCIHSNRKFIFHFWHIAPDSSLISPAPLPSYGRVIAREAERTAMHIKPHSMHPRRRYSAGLKIFCGYRTGSCRAERPWAVPCWHQSRSQTFPGRPDWAVEKHHRSLPTWNSLPFTSTLGNVSDALKSQNEPTFQEINGKVKGHEMQDL